MNIRISSSKFLVKVEGTTMVYNEKSTVVLAA